MKKTFLTILALGLFCSLPVLAQTDDMQDWMQNGRPEHVEEYVTDDTGTHKMPRKVGVPGQVMNLTGTPRIPILLVQFPDRPFYASGKTTEEVLANFDLYFNSYDDDLVKKTIGSKGSVFSYFDDMSNGQFQPFFDILGPVTLSKGYAEYGKNGTSVRDVYISSFYKEAISLAVKNCNVDWSDYDNNGDGKVDFVHIVYAGWGENTVAQNDPDAIWAKELSAGQSVTTDTGEKVDFACFAMSAEARRASFPEEDKDLPATYNPEHLKMDGVGVCLHEISHALGLPDLYDTRNVAFGMDIWSVMDYGEYCQNGYCPVAYTAYERDFMGWDSLIVLNEPQVLNIACFAKGGKGYKIVNPDNEDEFYVLENRQSAGWDLVLGKNVGHGLQVTHVDYNKSRWMANNVNTDQSHQRCTIIAANGVYTGTNQTNDASVWLACLAGQLYPGTTFNYNLTDESTPAAQVYSGNAAYSDYMHQPIRNIEENEDGTITLCFRTNGKLQTPVTQEASEVDMTTFTANWESVENATKYVVEMETETEQQYCDTTEYLSFTYTDLQPNEGIKYRVKALADSPEDYVESEWSEYVYLKTDADLIRETPDSEKQVTVYATNGMPVSHCAANELHRLDLRPGIYVVKYANGCTKKVLLR